MPSANTSTVRTVLPADWQAALTADAERRGENEAEYIRAAIRQRLPREVRDGLSTPRGRGQPRKVVVDATPP